MSARLVAVGKVRPGSRAIEVRIDNHPDSIAEEAGLIPWFPLKGDGSLPDRAMGGGR